MDTILAIDANAAGVSFQLFSVQGDGRLEGQINGRLEGVGGCPRLKARRMNGDSLAHRAYRNEDVGDVAAAFAAIDAWLRDELRVGPLAVGHRIVQGGPEHARPILIDDAVMVRLEQLVASAPLHQLHNLALIRAIRADHPALPQVACFDTAFHLSRAAASDGSVSPYQHHAGTVRPSGLHGLSYESVARTLSLVAPGIAKRRVIVARLGDSSSMCALRDGRSVECIPARYAFGPLPADDFASEINPDIAQLLRSENGMPTEALQDASRRSYGLSGPAGAGEVAFELEGARSPQVRHAVERLGYRTGLDAGLLAAALEGLDAFVFTGEIGERSAAIRASIAERLSWLGATLDAPANAQHARLISRHDGRIPIYVLPSDDELTIARHTLAILLNGPSPH